MVFFSEMLRGAWVDLYFFGNLAEISQAWVVQTLNSVIHWKSHYPVDKYLGNQLHHALHKDLPSG